jgi:hypothetical protein
MIPIVNSKSQPKKYKIISFGYSVTVDGEVPATYKFRYPPVGENTEDLHQGTQIRLEVSSQYSNTTVSFLSLVVLKYD